MLYRKILYRKKANVISQSLVHTFVERSKFLNMYVADRPCHRIDRAAKYTRINLRRFGHTGYPH